MCKPVDAPASATSTTRILGGRRTAVAEVRAQLKISVPVAFSAVLRRSMVIWTVAFVGRLGASAMAAAALANSATNTFALSIMVGLSSASVTLVSQAVGAFSLLKGRGPRAHPPKKKPKAKPAKNKAAGVEIAV